MPCNLGSPICKLSFFSLHAIISINRQKKIKTLPKISVNNCNLFLLITDSSFAINCGGSKTITSSDGTEYDIDNANLTTASYYVTDTARWGVSNVGSFADAPGSNYIISSLSQFLNTLDSELFQQERMSPSSLRYYGLGLENGNYSVKLQFAEIAFPDSPTWKSVGRRVFNIYVQVIRQNISMN